MKFLQNLFNWTETEIQLSICSIGIGYIKYEEEHQVVHVIHIPFVSTIWKTPKKDSTVFWSWKKESS